MGGVFELEDVLDIHYLNRDGCKSIAAPCYNVAEIFEDKQLNAQEDVIPITNYFYLIGFASFKNIVVYYQRDNVKTSQNKDLKK